VALVGRSNVGKSTLLNALLGLEAARAADSRAAVSDKPGETQSLHFYGVGRMDVGPPGAEHTAPALVITDMPGFGFAYLNEHDAARCRRLTRAYLLATPPGTPLRRPRTLILVDRLLLTCFRYRRQVLVQKWRRWWRRGRG
jgi:GTP-binding protein